MVPGGGQLGFRKRKMRQKLERRDMAETLKQTACCFRVWGKRKPAREISKHGDFGEEDDQTPKLTWIWRQERNIRCAEWSDAQQASPFHTGRSGETIIKQSKVDTSMHLEFMHITKLSSRDQ